MSIATVINWMVNLLISAFIPGIIKAIGQENIGWIFVCMGLFTLFSYFFMLCFMKETRGLTSLQIEEMFAGKVGKQYNKLNTDLVNDSSAATSAF